MLTNTEITPSPKDTENVVGNAANVAPGTGEEPV
jgi:hypothetical protein